MRAEVVAYQKVEYRDGVLVGGQIGLRVEGGVVGDRPGVARLQVRFRDPFHHHEPGHGVFDCGADGQQTVVAQHDAAVAAEIPGDALAAVDALHLHLLVVEYGMVVVEDARLLGNGFEKRRRCRERRTVGRVRVRDARDVGARRQDRVVDVVGGQIGSPAAALHRAVRLHEHQLLRRCLAERRVDIEQPEAIGAFGVACADMPVAEIAPAQRGEHPVAECYLPFALLADRISCR